MAEIASSETVEINLRIETFGAQRLAQAAQGCSASDSIFLNLLENKMIYLQKFTNIKFS